MAGGIRIDHVAVDNVVQQLSIIESNTEAKNVFVNSITDALTASNGEAVEMARELNEIIGEILNEYDALIAATRVLISQANVDFAQTDQHIADGFVV